MDHAYNQPMVEESGTFAERFEKLRGALSYGRLSELIEERTGHRISGQAMHKWVKADGGITLENARVIAEFFGVTPAWLLFGEGPGPQHPDLADIIRGLPDDNPQQVLDFISYKIERAEGVIATDKMADYMKMIEGIRADMDRRKNQP